MKRGGVLFWLFLSSGIICVSLAAAKLRKEAAEKATDGKSKRGSVCSNNNGGQWINEAGGHFIYECTGRNSITTIGSEYDQHHRDRRWKMTCGYNKAVKECAWTAYVNNWDQPLRIECPHSGFIAGIESQFRKANYDRRFKFKCCHDTNVTSL